MSNITRQCVILPLAISVVCITSHLVPLSTEPVFNKDQPLLTHINSTHAGLNLQGWTSGGCPITALMLDFRPKGTWAWQSLKANSTSQLFLSELREATWYELKMKACNSAGCGNQSSQFATTDYDGSKCCLLSLCFRLTLEFCTKLLLFGAPETS